MIPNKIILLGYGVLLPVISRLFSKWDKVKDYVDHYTINTTIKVHFNDKLLMCVVSVHLTT